MSPETPSHPEGSAWLHERHEPTVPRETSEQASDRLSEAERSALEMQQQAAAIDARTAPLRDEFAAKANGDLNTLSPADQQAWRQMEALEDQAASLRVQAADLRANNAG